MFSIQNIFPGWKIEQKLGEGSFGGVYEISRLLPDGNVEHGALKKLSVPRDPEEIEVLQAQSFSMDRIRAYFKNQMEELVQEYMFMQELAWCPTVVSCQDVRYIQHEDGIGWDIYIRMELLKPLKKSISKQYSEYQVLSLGMDICRALLACESLNIIHRDIKPENILVSENGKYKLADFGIAKVSEKTETGTLAGTNAYMAPEVANRQHYGKEVDIYSLGLVLYWMANDNVLPFLPPVPKIPTAEQRQEAIAKRLVGEPLPPPRNGSPELKQVILRACAYEPEKRFQSAREFGIALQRIFRTMKATDTDSILHEIGITKEMMDGEPGSTFRGSSKNGSSAAAKTAEKSSDNGKQKKKPKALRIALIAAVLIAAGGTAWFVRKPAETENNPEAVMAMEMETGVSDPMAQTTETTIPEPTSPFLYENTADGICITGWNEGIAAELAIPEVIDDTPVVAITDKAFSGSPVTAVQIPLSVQWIGEGAFSDCEKLQKISLPEGIQEINSGMFSGCTSLAQVVIPTTIVRVGDRAFENCASLEEINLPQGVTEISDYAFSGCSLFNDISLPDALERIGEYAFRDCSGLTGIDIPDSVTAIGVGAFYASGMLTATMNTSFAAEVHRFMPEDCEILYTGIEKPQIYGEVGDIITFGSYEQDNDLTNGSEPIEWQILEKDGTKMYVISKYGLDSKKYNDVWEVVCWENCKIRAWLNQDFYTTAFNDIEQSMIVTTDVRSVHPSGSYPTKIVQDKVYLLDYNGAYGYFKSAKARTCIATPYADAQGSAVEYGGRCWWWLREGYFVDLASIPNTRRGNLTDSGGTVRPMICIETAD